jgi:hypothetical protein
MARYSLLEKLAGNQEPEVDGTALLKLAETYGRDEAETGFDGSAIVKLAEAYGQTKEAGMGGLKAKLMGMLGKAKEKADDAKEGARGKLLSALGGERKSSAGEKAAKAGGIAALMGGSAVAGAKHHEPARRDPLEDQGAGLGSHEEGRRGFRKR